MAAHPVKRLPPGPGYSAQRSQRNRSLPPPPTHHPHTQPSRLRPHPAPVGARRQGPHTPPLKCCACGVVGAAKREAGSSSAGPPPPACLLCAHPGKPLSGALWTNTASGGSRTLLRLHAPLPLLPALHPPLATLPRCPAHQAQVYPGSNRPLAARCLDTSTSFSGSVYARKYRSGCMAARVNTGCLAARIAAMGRQLSDSAVLLCTCGLVGRLVGRQAVGAGGGAAATERAAHGAARPRARQPALPATHSPRGRSLRSRCRGRSGPALREQVNALR